MLSHAVFNKAMGLVLAAPVTQGGGFARSRGFAVSLNDTGMKTPGVLLMNQCRTLDFQALGAKYIEAAPDEIREEALMRFTPIFS